MYFPGFWGKYGAENVWQKRVAGSGAMIHIFDNDTSGGRKQSGQIELTVQDRCGLFTGQSPAWILFYLLVNEEKDFSLFISR